MLSGWALAGSAGLGPALGLRGAWRGPGRVWEHPASFTGNSSWELVTSQAEKRWLWSCWYVGAGKGKREGRERGQGRGALANSACELAGVTWQAIPTCSQTINPRNRAIAVPQWPWGGHGRGSVVTEVSRCHGYTKAAAVGRCVSVSQEKKEQLWPVPGTGFCQPGCCYRGGEGHWWGPPPRCVASNPDPTLSPSIRTKCAAAPSGQSLHPFPSVGLLDPMRRGQLQGSTRAISDNGLEHRQEERRVSE